MHVFGLWEEAGVPGENPDEQRAKMQSQLKFEFLHHPQVFLTPSCYILHSMCAFPFQLHFCEQYINVL